MTRNELLIKLFETDSSVDQVYDVSDMIMEYISQSCKNGEPEKIDELFSLISTDCVPTMYLSMLLRVTFSIAPSLKQWRDFRDRSIKSAIARGEQTTVFIGLDDHSVQNYKPNAMIQRILGIEINDK